MEFVRVFSGGGLPSLRGRKGRPHKLCEFQRLLSPEFAQAQRPPAQTREIDKSDCVGWRLVQHLLGGEYRQ